jgi:c-di-GMP-binding flagellar brake protein YcgR
VFKGKDRRKYKRLKARVEVEIQQYDSAPMLLASTDGASKDFSAAGILISRSEPLPVPLTVLVRFSLPGDKEKLEIVGRTLRCTRAEGGYEISLEFLDTTPIEIEKIQRYVEAGRDNKSTS